MMLRQHFTARRVAVLVAGLGLAGWLLPSFFSADRYRRRLERGLEHALQRPLTFGSTSFRLLPHPGFSIENVVVQEDPAFGSEPFAQVERIRCDLRWRSLWRSRLEFSRLNLERASFNLVRNSEGQWNFEKLLLESGVASGGGAPGSGPRDPGGVAFDMDDARINFKVRDTKKPFALTDVRARFQFDRARQSLNFRLTASPIRSDLSLPTPGPVEFEGEWSPGKNLEGPLDATLRARGALLYDWVPLVSGRNPGVYGLLDSELHLTGSVRDLRMEGQASVHQLYRWEQLPPRDSFPIQVRIRAEVDRHRGRVLLESVEASLADSRLHLTGTIDQVPASPQLDLVAAVERSRLEDLGSLGHRLLGLTTSTEVTGRVDGFVSIRGPWTQLHYAGFLDGREVRVRTPSGTFPASDVALRISDEGARLAPVTLTLAPRVELVAEGAVQRRMREAPGREASGPPSGARSVQEGPPRYELVLAAKAIPLHDLLRFARAVGFQAGQNFDAHGTGTATLRLAGQAWPYQSPRLTGQAELRMTRLLVPGLTEPLNLPRAHLEFDESEVVADPVVAVIGTGIFTGRVEHRGPSTSLGAVSEKSNRERKEPWRFDLHVKDLSLEQGAQWFDALGQRPPLPLLSNLPGLSSFAARRAAASNVLGALNARGRFSASVLTYRALALRDFQAWVEVSGRSIRVSQATFRVGGGGGEGRAVINLAGTPAATSMDFRLTGASLATLAPHLPSALHRLRGSFSGSGHFETRGLSHDEITSNLRGRATVDLTNVSLAEFDPVEALARAGGLGTLEPGRGATSIRVAPASFRVGDRRVILESTSLELAGAKLKVAGSYNFDGAADLALRADLSGLRRRWLEIGGDGVSSERSVELHLAGPLHQLAITGAVEVSHKLP